MYTILRGAVVYIVLLIVFRINGKRSLTQITTFDFVLLLIISEVVQQAMLSDDNSLTNAFLLVITLIGLDIGLSLLSQRSSLVQKLVNSVPLVLIENGKIHKDRLERERIEEADILAKAREQEGIEHLDQIKYAVLETSGVITIIPRKGDPEKTG